MRKLATLTAAAALLAAGGLLLAPNTAWAVEITVLSCVLDTDKWDVEACETTESTDIPDCFAAPPINVYEPGASCAAALDNLLETVAAGGEGYGGRKAYQFSPVSGVSSDSIVYTLMKGD